MSVIYSAGQFEDAFSPKKLGNWEAAPKDSCLNPGLYYSGTCGDAIADSRGHLLPWIPRDRSKTWGMLRYYAYQNQTYHQRNVPIPLIESFPDHYQRLRLPNANRATSRAKEKRNLSYTKLSQKKQDWQLEPDHLLLYLRDLSLPIIWLVGPPTRKTNHTRKQFSRQLATKLGFSYINLDDKICEWKNRQTTCTCQGDSIIDSFPGGSRSSHSLEFTSIAPAKLPTNIPVSPPKLITPSASNTYIHSLLESQRITFDTALPLDRNKILELIKFSMLESLPCSGFVMDVMPFDLLEGIAFEKIFYPAALAIYFTEGAAKQTPPHKPKENKLPETKKKLISPIEKNQLEKSRQENVYLRMNNYKRLGNFSPLEGEKICKKFGRKTIRIVNAEDVENDTMEFLNELVQINLCNHKEIIEGNAELDTIGGGTNKCDCEGESTKSTRGRRSSRSRHRSNQSKEKTTTSDSFSLIEKQEVKPKPSLPIVKKVEVRRKRNSLAKRPPKRVISTLPKIGKNLPIVKTQEAENSTNKDVPLISSHSESLYIETVPAIRTSLIKVKSLPDLAKVKNKPNAAAWDAPSLFNKDILVLDVKDVETVKHHRKVDLPDFSRSPKSNPPVLNSGDDKEMTAIKARENLFTIPSLPVYHETSGKEHNDGELVYMY